MSSKSAINLYHLKRRISHIDPPSRVQTKSPRPIQTTLHLAPAIPQRIPFPVVGLGIIHNIS
jgi:hypothetical protein